MPSGITKRTRWFVGRDTNGTVRYGPVGDWTEAAFARHVLGNIYARIDQFIGYGVGLRSPADMNGTNWAVFTTRRKAEAFLEAMTGGFDRRTRAFDR